MYVRVNYMCNGVIASVQRHKYQVTLLDVNFKTIKKDNKDQLGSKFKTTVEVCFLVMNILLISWEEFIQ